MTSTLMYLRLLMLLGIGALSSAGLGFAASQEPVASVDGQVISEQELMERVEGQLQKLRNQEFEIKQSALENLIIQRVVEAEAARRGISSAELMQQEVDSKVPLPTDAEIEAFYAGQKERINRPLEEVREQISNVLVQSRQQKLRQVFFDRLRKDAQVAVYLKPPRFDIHPDPSRLRGNPDAPVQIVEFSDFQCPYCQNAYPIIRALLEKYPDEVNFSYRDYPLRNIHGEAQIAAEASRCAAEQDRFWDYHDRLFEHPHQLGRDALIDHAAALELNTARFELCLEAGRYRQEIEQDMQEAVRAGVTGTPAFFINGIFVSGSQAASVFERIIESELAAIREGTAPHQ